MKKRIKRILQIVLVLVFAFCLYRFVSLKIDNAKTDSEIAAVKEQIREMRLRNGEYEDILSTENEEDFYRNLAEDQLGYGEPNEKVYQSVPSK